jgi:hypothetical protein
MSALGQKRTSDWRPLMSALPPKADIGRRALDVRFVPIAEVAVTRSVELIVQPDAHDVVHEMGVDVGCVALWCCAANIAKLPELLKSLNLKLRL